MSSSYTVSVRSLCEFTARRGDLDRRFTPSATALEGQLGQHAVTMRRGPGYETELSLETSFECLRVRGRADGWDAARNQLEEVKTIRGLPDDIPENRRALHWAQLATYGALFCRQSGAVELNLALVYVDADTQAETVLHQRCSAAELEAGFIERCRGFLAWAQQEAAHRVARDAALAALPFPPGEFRPGQRDLAEAVYRAAVNGRCLLAQAPTGIGKTLGVLFPLLRAMPGQGLDKIGYLTCKGTGRATALEALEQLREATPGRSLRVLAFVAKDQACEHPDKACHGDACPLARGFHDRLPQARAEAVALGWLDPAAQRRIALAHGICPYYLGQELLRWADVVVGDVHHVFDHRGQLHALAGALDWRVGLLVDEAHNLIDRTRQMYSTSLRQSQLQGAMVLAPAGVRRPISRLHRALADLASQQSADYAAHERIPDELADALGALVVALGDHLQGHPLATGALLELHFDVLKLQRLVDRFGPHSVFDVQRLPVDPARAVPAGQVDFEGEGIDACCSIRNIVPGAFVQGRFKDCHTVTLFSATLGSQSYQRDLLGLPEDTGWIDVPPAFAPEHLCVRVAHQVSTRFPHREASLDAVVDVLARQFQQHPGNYLAFFSSFDYLGLASGRLAVMHPDVPQWCQSRAMDDASRRFFLQSFRPDGQGVAFAVLGGAFAEGVDLPGTRLVGAFIATLGLPPLSPVQAQFKSRLDQLFGADHGYADLVPGLQKVVQAAGRVIRTPEDRGWLWLIDDRYRRPAVRRLLPAWWWIDRSPTKDWVR